MIAVILITGIFVSLLAISLLRGWVLSYLWLWFVVPLGVQPIGLWHAFGLSMMISMLTGSKVAPYPKPEGLDALKQLGETALLGVVSALFVLGIGYLVSGAVS